MNENANLTAARSFVRSLNILLKSARLYGFEHERTAAQFDTTWKELQAALSGAAETGLLLGVTGTQLLIDGIPLEAASAERSFAGMLNAARLASIQFSPRLTNDHFAHFVRAFTAAGAKPVVLLDRLRESLGDGQSDIRLNEVRFVAEDSASADTRTAAELTARTLGADADKVQEWLKDPQKLLQLIAAAEGGHVHPGASVAGGPDTGSQMPVTQEEDVVTLMQLLTRLGRTGAGVEGGEEPKQVQEQLAGLPASAQGTLQQALASLAAGASPRPDKPMLLELAEHLAVRFALERFERGEVRVNAVRELLNRMSREIDTLHTVLSAHEETLSRAGLAAESHADILDRQFWAAVPESGKRSVLLSPEAWCIPPRNILQFVEQLRQSGDGKTADAILLNYATCVHTDDPDGRRKALAGLTELAPQYASSGVELLDAAIRHVGEQLNRESVAEMQSLLSSTFVRLSQEAAARHHYPALRQAVVSLEGMERSHPRLVRSLQPRLGVAGRLGEFVEEALRTPRPPEGLKELLRRMPQPAAELLANRFTRCVRRDERERLVSLVADLGSDGVEQLRTTLRSRPAAEAAFTVGLLSRLDARELEETLPMRLRGWTRAYHDIVVRQLGASGARERGPLLLKVLSVLDPSVQAQAVDEIGLSGNPATVLPLMRLAGGELPESGDSYLRLKAIEALGRLCDAVSAPLLRQVVEAKQIWRWLHPRELRIAAAQALLKIDPEWSQKVLPGTGLRPDELAVVPLDPRPDAPWVRQRRYARTWLPRTLAAVASTLRGESHLTVKVCSLGGGLAASDRALPPGTETQLDLRSGLRHLHSDAMVREAHAHQVAFEIVRMDLEERTKLRHLLAGLQPRTA